LAGFEVTAEGGDAIAKELNDSLDLRTCFLCHGRWSARIATFSYRKDLSVRGFQTIWDGAHAALRNATRWLFIGYSLPEADIEIRHLLKTAQLARKDELTIQVILKDDPHGGDRYARFLGANVSIIQGGLAAWISQNLEEFCALHEVQAAGASEQSGTEQEFD
jgi:hypothetical protein